MDPTLAQDLLALLDERGRRASERRAALQRDFDDLVERSTDASRDDEHDPEGATIAFERSQILSLAAAADRDLADIDRAIERVGSGIHDRCETCGRQIPAERLRARPTTRRCVVCAEMDTPVT